MIEPGEVERLGGELAKLHACYSTADLRKVLNFAYANRLKGGALPTLARLLKEFATESKLRGRREGIARARVPNEARRRVSSLRKVTRVGQRVGRKTLQVLPNSSKPLLSTLQLAKVAVRRIARKLNLKKLLTALQIATAY